MNATEWIEKGKERIKKFGIKEWGTVLIVGICFLVAAIPGGTKEKRETENTEQKTIPEETTENKSYTDWMEERVEELLSTVENVGKVKVMITVASTEEKNVLKDGSYQKEKTAENDSEGGSRIIEKESEDKASVFAEEEPYLLSERYPEVIGVVVIAQGSGRGSVDYDILNAVQVLFDIPAHKIKIMKMK